MRNLHKAYYKYYFQESDFVSLAKDKEHSKTTVNIIKQHCDELCAPNILVKIEPNPIVNQTIKMTIAYPGLVTGVGINHEAKIEGAFKLGVHFEYTWGMPVVYGSSVKGVLRAYFIELYKGDLDAIDLIHDIFCGETRNVSLEKEIYKTEWLEMVKSEKNRKYSPKSIYECDIFFDAVITRANRNECILCSDSITPHNENQLKNSTPFSFLKIAPGCEMEFRFKLVDTKDGNGKVIFSKGLKMALFEEILMTVGVGAKTNVGYGQLHHSHH